MAPSTWGASGCGGFLQRSAVTRWLSLSDAADQFYSLAASERMQFGHPVFNQLTERSLRSAQRYLNQRWVFIQKNKVLKQWSLKSLSNVEKQLLQAKKNRQAISYRTHLILSFDIVNTLEFFEDKTSKIFDIRRLGGLPDYPDFDGKAENQLNVKIHSLVDQFTPVTNKALSIGDLLELWSLGIYPQGVVMKGLVVDGLYQSPFGFRDHDSIHNNNWRNKILRVLELSGGSELSGDPRYHQLLRNMQNLLKSLKTYSSYERQAAEMVLFYLIHERYSWSLVTEFIKEKVSPEAFSLTRDVREAFESRVRDRNDLGSNISLRARLNVERFIDMGLKVLQESIK